jgi:hypothetical protein
MRRFPDIKPFLITLISFFALPLNSAVSADQKLLSLVPPGAQVVAGMSATSPQGPPGNFLLVTHHNIVDLQDFFALTGVDSSRSIHQVILVAVADNSGKLLEHSLLASGHFDQSRIYKSSTDNGAEITHYRNVAVLSIQPFARERGSLDDVRLLAVLDCDILLFGTIASVHQELDRYLAGTAADSSIVQRLDRLRREDETWCLLVAPVLSDEIRNVLGRLDPALVRSIENGGAFQYGIHYSGHVEFEYEIAATSTLDPEAISNSLETALAGPNANASLLLPRSGIAAGSHTMHGVVKISRRRYDEWLAEISSHRTN